MIQNYIVFEFTCRAVFVPHEFPSLEVLCLRAPRHPAMDIVTISTWRSKYIDGTITKTKTKTKAETSCDGYSCGQHKTELVHKCNNHFIITTIMVGSQFENLIVVGTNLRQSESNS